MDTLKSMQLADDAAKYIKKDYKHTIIVGVIACVIILLAGYYYKWQTSDIYLYAVIMASIFFTRAMFEMAKPFYLVEIENYTIEKVPYQRIENTFDYYFHVLKRANVYACKKNLFLEANKQLATNIPSQFKIEDSIVLDELYDDNAEKSASIILLLSSTKTLVGFYINNKYYSNGL